MILAILGNLAATDYSRRTPWTLWHHVCESIALRIQLHRIHGFTELSSDSYDDSVPDQEVMTRRDQDFDPFVLIKYPAEHLAKPRFHPIDRGDYTQPYHH